jgi:hypothetical protein
MLEGESVSRLAGDFFDGTGANTRPPTATITDPDNHEINQAWVSYAYADTRATVGRQRIVIDTARFVGDVAFRQNQQTFDAVRIEDKTIEDLAVSYAYVSRINRVFDDAAPLYDWDSNSHLLHVAYSGCSWGTLTGYAYFLDFDSPDRVPAVSASSRTYGLSYAGSRPVTETVKALYRLEYATQSEFGDYPQDYRADYYTLELGAATRTVTLVAAYEVLGHNERGGGAGFKTPLATLHAHNGWADKFLVTPPGGLADLNVKGSVKLPADLTLLARYHWFTDDENCTDYGREAGLQLTYEFDARLSFTAKAASYVAAGDTGAARPPALRQDTDKFWLQADYVY